MFNTIDTGLIHGAQWFVRQLELFTTITKKELCKKLIYCFFISGEVWGISLILLGLTQISIIFFFIGPSVCFACLTITKKLQALVKSQNETDIALPEEIITRKWKRTADVCILLFLVTPWSFLVLFYTDNTLIELIAICSFFIQEAISVVTEYILCTTSLPPGEKKRIKLERAMKHAVPTSN